MKLMLISVWTGRPLTNDEITDYWLNLVMVRLVYENRDYIQAAE